MKDFSVEEKEFWARVELKYALYDVLTPEVVDALIYTRHNTPSILKLAASHCFLYPEELGVRRHVDRVRKLCLELENTNLLSEQI